jgi:hypothetical protein
MYDCEWLPVMEQNYEDALSIARQADPAITDIFFEPDAEGPYSP